MNHALDHITNWLCAHRWATCLLLCAGLIIVLKLDLPR